MSVKDIYYSSKIPDDEGNEIRHVILPKEIAKKVPRDRLMSEQEWRRLGVQMSQGWVHFLLHAPEPHILIFKRKAVQ